MSDLPTNGLQAPYRELRQTLLGFLRKHVADATVAEDLLQEVFLKALRAQAKGTQPGHVSGWLWGIARNSLIDHYRTQRPTETLPDELATPEASDDLAAQALATCLRPLAHQLAPRYRDTLLAIELEGCSLKTLAERENLSLSAIKSRASRARRMLKDQLLACCEVELSASGAVLDFQRRAPIPTGRPTPRCSP